MTAACLAAFLVAFPMAWLVSRGAERSGPEMAPALEDGVTGERPGGAMPPLPAAVGFGNSAALCADAGEG
jgi:hypothetical protein